MCGVKELRGAELSCYLNNIRSVGLRKCLYDHYLANKAYFSGITVKNIRESFTHNMAAKASWHWNYVTVTLLNLQMHAGEIGVITVSPPEKNDTHDPR